MELSLVELTSWVERRDPHAVHHLSLLAQSDEILSGRRCADPDLRERLAELLERWRYQYLNQHAGTMAEADWRLTAQLDLAAVALTGRCAREARGLRRALAAPVDEGDAVVRECLDQSVTLETICDRARQATRQHHAPAGQGGHEVLMYAPLYLSSHCINYCAYCGFRFPRTIERRHLSVEQALGQAEILAGRGFRHILLVAGDFPSLTTPDYYAAILRSVAAMGLRPSIEVAPQATSAYAEMAAAGAIGVTLYQETYDTQLYGTYHPKGSKASYDWRLEGLERAAEGGMQRLSLGVLLGLANPCADLRALIRHAHYLQQRFPGRKLSFGLPRIHKAPSEFTVPHTVDDETFIRLYCALRLAFPQSNLVLSTRELPALRDRLAATCITQLSAGSSTAPGGYDQPQVGHSCEEQFPVCDHRALDEVVAAVAAGGQTPVFE